MNEQPKPNKKPFFYYAMIAMLILMLLNAFVFPSLMTPRVTEVSYDKFLDIAGRPGDRGGGAAGKRA